VICGCGNKTACCVLAWGKHDLMALCSVGAAAQLTNTFTETHTVNGCKQLKRSMYLIPGLTPPGTVSLLMFSLVLFTPDCHC